MNKIVRLGEGWIATQLLFKRNGEVFLKEDYQENPILDEIDPAIFDVKNFKNHFLLHSLEFATVSDFP